MVYVAEVIVPFHGNDSDKYDCTSSILLSKQFAGPVPSGNVSKADPPNDPGKTSFPPAGLPEPDFCPPQHRSAALPPAL